MGIVAMYPCLREAQNLWISLLHLTQRNTLNGMGSILLKLLIKSLHPSSFQANFSYHHLDSISNTYAILIFLNSRCLLYIQATYEVRTSFYFILFLVLFKELRQIKNSRDWKHSVAFVWNGFSIKLLSWFLWNLGVGILLLVEPDFNMVFV